jgi:tripartite-type tricarboxylate transporter receptor subunit TctC
MRFTILATILTLACSGIASAQDYPSKPVTLVVPAAAGGGTDILGRSLAEELGTTRPVRPA